MSLPRRRDRGGFTLIELLVVISIIAVLVGLLLPAVQKVREAAARAKCQNSLHNLALAVHAFESTNSRLPPGSEGSVNSKPANPQMPQVDGTNWLVYTLPFVEQENLYRTYSFAVPWTSNAAVGQFAPPMNYCPSGAKEQSGSANEPNQNTTHYYAVLGPGTGASTAVGGINYTLIPVGGGTIGTVGRDGMLTYIDNVNFPANSPALKVEMTDVTDGLSNTLMIGELSYNTPPTVGVQVAYRSWIRGNNDGSWNPIGSAAAKNMSAMINSTFFSGGSNFNDISFGSNHIGGCNFAMGDGSVRYINQNTDLATLIMMSSKNKKEVFQMP